MTDNSLANAVYTVGQKMATNLVAKGVSGADADDGLTTLAGKILDIPNKQSTSLTIEVPLNLEYGDNFNITGVLSKCGGEVISNARIKLLVGSTVVDTLTTDSNGNVSFTQCPVATGTHSFQLVFDGDLNHLNSSSSVVTRDVAKETSVLTVNYPIAGSNHYTDSNVLVAGVLTDNDATPLANRSVKVCDSNDNVLGTLDTEADGSFTGNVTIQNAGAFTLKILHEGNEYYTLACSPREIVMVSPSLSLESDKSIISYNGGTNPESATLTATLHASDVDNKLVTFEVRKQSDDSLVETLSGYTNSSGIASVSYLGKGVGDIYIKAECNLWIQTYQLEDCIRVLNPSSDLTMWDTSKRLYANISYNSTKEAYYLKNSSDGFGIILLNDAFSFGNGVKISYDLLFDGTYNVHSRVGIWDGTYGLVLAKSYNSAVYFRMGQGGNNQDMPNPFSNVNTIVDTHTSNLNVWKHLEFTIESDGTLTGKCWDSNNVLECHRTTSMTTYTFDNIKFGFQHCHAYNNGLYIKNIKIKPL